MQPPALLDGDSLRLHVPAVRGALARSGPTYRGTVSIPIIQDIDLFITDRRVIVRADLFLGLFDADHIAWLPTGSPPAGSDVLLSASVSEQGVLGPALRLVAATGPPSAGAGLARPGVAT